MPVARRDPAEHARAVAARVDHGNALFSLGEWAQAAARYREALVLAPESAEIHFNLGNALARDGAVGPAMAALRVALEFDADHAGARTNLGNLLREAGQAEAALEEYRRALFLRPQDPAGRTNLGLALADLDRLDEALVWLTQAATAVPPDPPARAALGAALLQLGHAEDALAWFRVARDGGDNTAATRLGEGLCLLTMGALAAGWEGYEARPSTAPFKALRRAVRWDGTQDLRGQTLLAWAEQGLGDSIQFVRYLPMLRARGARVVLLAQAALHRLFAGLADEMVVPGASVSFDFHCPLPSLPRGFATVVGSIPAAVPYLSAEPGLVAKWAGELGGRPRVGLVWSGNPDFAQDRVRSLPFAAVTPLLTTPGIGWHILQKDVRARDAGDLAKWPELHVPGPALEDFADTGALVAEMDLVISADTSVAHLAGALGRPCWIMLPFAADARWMRGREDSPWYPTVRLFRQPARGDWASVVAAIGAALGEHFAPGRGGDR